MLSAAPFLLAFCWHDERVYDRLCAMRLLILSVLYRVCVLCIPVFIFACVACAWLYVRFVVLFILYVTVWYTMVVRLFMLLLVMLLVFVIPMLSLAMMSIVTALPLFGDSVICRICWYVARVCGYTETYGIGYAVCSADYVAGVHYVGVSYDAAVVNVCDFAVAIARCVRLLLAFDVDVAGWVVSVVVVAIVRCYTYIGVTNVLV